jgi:hypothetical protein
VLIAGRQTGSVAVDEYFLSTEGDKMVKNATLIVLFFFSIVPASAEMLVDTAWVRTYSASGNGDDYPCAIAVDDAGNVYVSGFAYGEGTSSDYTTIKYDASGNQLWAAVYDGPANHWDEASDMAIDHEANIYVTGRSAQWDTIPYNYDYATVKYDSAGNELWVRRHDGSEGLYDEAWAIAVDAAGNAYVTGSGCEAGEPCGYITIKYRFDGTEHWIRCYDGGSAANAIAVDDNGNVCVAGDSWGGVATDWDYSVVKYDSLGNELWAQRYDGPAHMTEYCNDAEVDRWGNLYVTGWSYGVGTDYDWATVKYDSAGNELWVRRYNGPGNGEDIAGFLALDDSGNVYVTGTSTGSESGYDYATVKYDSVGNEVWVRSYNGYGVGSDMPFDLTLDDSGSVYVVGRSWGSGSAFDYVTIKYTPSGAQSWAKRYYGLEGNSYDWGRAITLDESGDVFVSGSSQGVGTEYDFLTIRYVQTYRWRGDANADGVIDVGDVVHLLNYLYKGGPSPDPPQTGDTNCSCGQIELGDVVLLIEYLYRHGWPPDC